MADIVERVQLMSSVRAEFSCGCLTLLMAAVLVKLCNLSGTRGVELGKCTGSKHCTKYRIIPWYQCVSWAVAQPSCQAKSF